MQRIGRVLIIAGSDSSGAAGVQADIKTVTALGGYAATAITAVTVQDGERVHAVHAIAPRIVAAQARAVLDDIGADAVKTGMLGSAETVAAVVEVLDAASGGPLVVDPVLASTSGTALIDDAGRAALLRELAPRAALITPNAPEAEALTGLEVASLDGQRRAAEVLLKAGAGAVLVKGGHVPGETVVDLLATPAGETLFEAVRLGGRGLRGTGCTLASACAVGLAQRLPLAEAVGRAFAYVQGAMTAAPALGRGAGPLDHGWPLREPRRP